MDKSCLRIEQQFELENMRRAAEGLSQTQALELLIQAKRLLFIKDNVLQSLTPK